MRKLKFGKATGPKPAKILLVKAATLARPNSASQIAVALAMRPNGATQKEIIALLGNPHRNKINQLIASRQVKKYVLPDDSRATRIRLVK